MPGVRLIELQADEAHLRLRFARGLTVTATQGAHGRVADELVAGLRGEGPVRCAAEADGTAVTPADLAATVVEQIVVRNADLTRALEELRATRTDAFRQELAAIESQLDDGNERMRTFTAAGDGLTLGLASTADQAGPDPEALALADEWTRATQRMAELGGPRAHPSGLDSIEALERRIRQAEMAVRSSQHAPGLTPNQEQQLRALHDELEAAQRAVEKRASRRSIKRLEECEEAERALLDQLGITSYLDFVLGVATSPSGTGQPSEAAQAELQSLIERRDQMRASEQHAAEFQALGAHVERLRQAAAEMMGQDPGDDVAAALRTWRPVMADPGVDDDDRAALEDAMAQLVAARADVQQRLEAMNADVTADDVDDALRRALADHPWTADFGPLPVVFDDALSVFPDHLREHALAILTELSEEVQVVVCTDDPVITAWDAHRGPVEEMWISREVEALHASQPEAFADVVEAHDHVAHASKTAYDELVAAEAAELAAIDSTPFGTRDQRFDDVDVDVDDEDADGAPGASLDTLLGYFEPAQPAPPSTFEPVVVDPVVVEPVAVEPVVVEPVEFHAAHIAPAPVEEVSPQVAAAPAAAGEEFWERSTEFDAEWLPPEDPAGDPFAELMALAPEPEPQPIADPQSDEAARRDEAERARAQELARQEELARRAAEQQAAELSAQLERMREEQNARFAAEQRARQEAEAAAQRAAQEAEAARRETERLRQEAEDEALVARLKAEAAAIIAAEDRAKIADAEAARHEAEAAAARAQELAQRAEAESQAHRTDGAYLARLEAELEAARAALEESRQRARDLARVEAEEIAARDAEELSRRAAMNRLRYEDDDQTRRDVETAASRAAAAARRAEDAAARAEVAALQEAEDERLLARLESEATSARDQTDQALPNLGSPPALPMLPDAPPPVPLYRAGVTEPTHAFGTDVEFAAQRAEEAAARAEEAAARAETMIPTDARAVAPMARDHAFEARNHADVLAQRARELRANVAVDPVAVREAEIAAQRAEESATRAEIAASRAEFAAVEDRVIPVSGPWAGYDASTAALRAEEAAARAEEAAARAERATDADHGTMAMTARSNAAESRGYAEELARRAADLRAESHLYSPVVVNDADEAARRAEISATRAEEAAQRAEWLAINEANRVRAEAEMYARPAALPENLHELEAEELEQVAQGDEDLYELPQEEPEGKLKGLKKRRAAKLSKEQAKRTEKLVNQAAKLSKRCKNHNLEDAVGVCGRCENSFCRHCIVKVGGKGENLCVDCALQAAGVRSTKRRR